MAIGPPAAAAAAVNWRSNVVPVDLTARLRSDIFRQLASDRGGSVQIGGSVVDLVVDRRVSGHRIDQNEPYPTVHGSWSVGLSQGAGCGGRMCH